MLLSPVTPWRRALARFPPPLPLLVVAGCPFCDRPACPLCSAGSRDAAAALRLWLGLRSWGAR